MQTELETMAGVVSAVNEYGLKLEGRGDEWVNYTKLEWRGFFEAPQKGDNVKLGLSRDKNGKWWIKTCEIQKHGNGPSTTYEDGRVPGGGRDLSIMRQTAIKAATEVVVAFIAAGELKLSEDVAVLDFGIDIAGLAQELERWMTREDVNFS